MAKNIFDTMETKSETRIQKDNLCGWVLYDDDCGFCRQWIPFWKNTLRKRGFEIVPLQEEWVRRELRLDETELLRDLRILLVNGTQLQGADAYRFAIKRIWWTYPLYLFSITPLLRRFFDRGYRTIAHYRYHISRGCNLSGDSPN
jgi:predicted DCC family thiol-disulfide oxidoreductase YuxK